MSAGYRACAIAYWLALIFWISAIVSAGVAAMSTFTTLPDPDLGLHLERFAEFDPERHGRIAAGLVMEPIFTFVDLVQVVAGLIVIVTAVLQVTWFGLPWRRLSNTLRLAGIVLAAGLFAFRATTITPEMNRDLRAYWSAAEAGEIEVARRHSQAFTARHRTARLLFDLSLIALVVAAGASAVALGPGAATRSENRQA